MAKLTETNVIDSLLNEILQNYDESQHSLINDAFIFASEGHRIKKENLENLILHTLFKSPIIYLS
jgi:hypothetical protein